MRWQVLGASVTGAGHLDLGQACQDAHAFRLIGDDAVVAVVCDGAGSATRSAAASRAAADSLSRDPLVDSWVASLQSVPAEAWQASWERCAKDVFHNALQAVSTLLPPDTDLLDFSTTAIMVVGTPRAVACAHVGDGRACFSPAAAGGWIPLFVPARGDAPNETIFLTSFPDGLDDTYWKDEARVYPGQPAAFALMSDGCEKGAFECWIPRSSGVGFHDPNRPFPPFFDPVTATIMEMSAEGIPNGTMQEEWIRFVTAGVERFRTESDDRTMVFAVLLPDPAGLQ